MSTKLLWLGLTLLEASKAWNPANIPAVDVVGAVMMVIGAVMLLLNS